eukprot:scpid70559/ scgid0093/ Putative uncharacterized protein C10orf122
MSEEWMSQRRHFRPGQTGRFIPHLTYGDLYGVQMRSDPPFDSTKTQVRDHKLRMRPKTDSDLVTQRFSARMQDATSLPFSTHDNRHGHEDTGSHFDTGLGRKKQSYGRRMHMSKGFKWSPPEEGLGRSVQKDDFVVRSKTEPINLTDQALRFRRYPKVYPAPRPKSSGKRFVTLASFRHANPPSCYTQ